MSNVALKLYVEAAQEGKRSDGGFKAEVHRYFAKKLNEQFPGFDFTERKVKSKLSQVSVFARSCHALFLLKI